jgi:DNA gyrase subunit A
MTPTEAENNTENSQIIPRVIEEEMKTAYINYAMSVIVGRALPDVRDGLKPVHRRILYAMYDLGMFHNKASKKCARIVGEVLGKYHPHGDASVYDALVRMAQDFSLRYPLIKGQGNFGCFTGDTKVKLTDGRDLSFEDLIKEYNQGKKNYTYTVNPDRLIEIAEIKHPRLTKKNQEIIKVVIDTGEEIKSTLDHKFMLRNGKYCEAQKLREGNSLMPLNEKLSIKEDVEKKDLIGYSLIHQPKTDEWMGSHILADNWKLHAKHASELHKDPAYKEKVMKSRILGYVNTLIQKHKKITIRIYDEERPNNYFPKAKNALKYFDNFSEMVEQAKIYNHKVSFTEVLSKREDVYDLTIERTHNFALASGVFVHNSVDGDSAASMRYTEAKLQKLSEDLLKDIEKNTVNFKDNFDASLQEPEVLPSKLPNLLINGSSGIAVGMATNIPPHNVSEVCDGVIATIDDPDISTETLMEIIPGPDFPTGGEVGCGTPLLSAYSRGKGKVTIKAVVNITDDKIVVSEIPYQVNKEDLIKQIADLVRNKTIEGIRNINDESDREGIRIVIDLKRDVDSNIVLNQLFKYSRLKVSFGINMLALVNFQPKILGLKDIISEHISHRKEIIVRRTKFDLDQAEKRVHILQGLLVAIDNIDQIIPGIKKSKTVDEAKEFLISTYSLTVIQAKAILEMRLQKLASLEQEKIRFEHSELLERIKYYQEILGSETKIFSLIKEELQEIKTNYGDERRSKIAPGEDEEIDMEELIEEETVVVTVTNSGYVKRIPLDTYKTQGRGGKGVKAAGMKEEDFVERLYVTSTHDYLLFFTDKGQVYWKKVYHVPEGSRQAKGKHIANLLEMDQDENINAVIPVRDFKEGYLFMATRGGTVKKTSLMEFSRPRRGGIRAISLDENDTLIGVKFTTGDKEIILATKYGHANRFNENTVRSMGRTARGVRGIRLSNNDKVIGMITAESGKQILTLTEKGYGKRTPVEDYRLCNRGGKGVTNIKITDKNGPVKSVKVVDGSEGLMLVSKNGIAIRIKCSEISLIGRATQGVRVMRMSEGDSLAAAAKIIEDEDEPPETQIGDLPPSDDNINLPEVPLVHGEKVDIQVVEAMEEDIILDEDIAEKIE